MRGGGEISISAEMNKVIINKLSDYKFWKCNNNNFPHTITMVSVIVVDARDDSRNFSRRAAYATKLLKLMALMQT